MNLSITQKVNLFLFPASLLAAAYASLPHFAGLSAQWRQLMPYATSLVLVMGVLLCIHFNRSRAFFVLLLLAGFYWIKVPLSGGGTSVAVSRGLDGILSFFLPINIVLFTLMREKGIFSSAGRKRFLFLLVQGAALMILCRTGQADAHQNAVGWLQGASGGYAALPRPAIPVMWVCGAVIALKCYMRQSLVDSAFLGVLAAMAIIFATPPSLEVSTVFVCAAGLIITFSILQDSHNMAYRDDLTGLHSRRALNEQLEGLGKRYAIAMLDLDHFKRVNDSYGHDVGDQLLRMAAARMRATGGGGRVFRYGGEEFAFVFPGKGVEEVLAHLEELRGRIASYRFSVRGPDRPSPAGEGRKMRSGSGAETTVSVTVSIGVAGTDTVHGSPRQVLSAADEALYRAKQKGRNRVCTASRR